MKETVSIEKEGIKIVITHMPYRKKPCLAVQIDNCLYKVASFNDEETAQWFVEILDEMFGNRRVEDE